MRYKETVCITALIALDILSQGRVILGAGAGVDFDFTPVDPITSPKHRAEILDESLEILAHLLAGEPVTYHGQHFTFDNVQLVPGPVQRPRIPVWIGGDSQPAYRRAARWDGWVIGTIDEQQNITLTPEQVGERVAAIRRHRTDAAPFTVAVAGATAPGNDALPRAYAAAGATWWFECLFAGSKASDSRFDLRGNCLHGFQVTSAHVATQHVEQARHVGLIGVHQGGDVIINPTKLTHAAASSLPAPVAMQRA